MPSTRRVKLFGLFMGCVVLLILYLTADARRAQAQDFHGSTLRAMDAKHKAAAAQKDAENADIGQRLRDAAAAAKNAADAKSPNPALAAGKGKEVPIVGPAAEKADGEGKNMGRRPKAKGGEKWDMNTGKEAPGQSEEKESESPPESPEEHEVEVELNSILKRSPIIIFSKSYCPFSAKAKRILVEKYAIVPSPFVVELDQHPLGPKLQASLEKTTGRRTVPNVLINGKSIGGGDDVEALDTGGDLVDKVKSMAGKRIMEIRVREGH